MVDYDTSVLEILTDIVRNTCKTINSKIFDELNPKRIYKTYLKNHFI
jgi:hypothetical protein